MTQQITPLPAPPQPSDSPVDFDQKAFALLGGLPQFVNEANTLGGQMTALGENSAESAAAALASKNAAATSASNSAGSAIASGQSASNSASSANAANQSRIEAQNAADAAAASAESVDTAYLRNRANHTGAQAIDTVEGLQSALDSKADSTTVAQAIAMAATFTAVPTTFQATIVVVTLPHLRCMWWNGTKYVRAPWHRPGEIFYSDAPAANITQGIQLRSDVTYNTADHPDLAELYGFVGPTFVLKDGRARVLRGADLGRGIDSALVNGYLQEDAIRNFTGSLSGYASGYFSDILDGTGVFDSNATTADTFLRGGPTLAGNGRMVATIDASKQVPTASENRVRSLVATPYVTR